MQRYENYKPSGIQWIEKIPNQWNVERAKWIFQRMERPIRPEDGVVTAFRDGQVTLRTNRRTEGFTNAIQEHGYQGIRQGDLVIHAMDAFAGAIGVSDSDGKSTPVYAACVPRGEHDVNSYYYAYLLRYMAHSGFIESLSKGIRERSTDFRFAEFRELPLPIPSRAEQDRIVSFLDQKTAEIDAAIAKKERLIELLQEQKSILINQAVTHGLNPDVPMRDSGVEWIGEIPTHWRVAPVYSKFNVKLGKMLDAKKIAGRHLRRYLRNTDVQWSGINTDDLPMMDISPLEMCRYTVRKGDLLVCEGGDVGRCAIWGEADDEIGYQKALHRVRQISDVGVGYFRFFMLAASQTGALASGANTNTIAHLTCEMFRRMRLTCPSAEEQERISVFLTDVEAQVHVTAGNAMKEIDALREMKGCIISNAVTGKIKV